MKQALWSGAVVFFSIALTGCGGGDTTPLSINDFVNNPTGTCTTGNNSNTSSCAPNSNDPDASDPIPSVITLDNYIGLAAKVTGHIDNISSARPGQNTPVHLTDLLIEITRGISSPDSAILCEQASDTTTFCLENNPTSGQTTAQLTNYPIINSGFVIDGSVTVTGGEITPLDDLNANLMFNVTYRSTNEEISFDSGIDSIALGLNRLDNETIETILDGTGTGASFRITEKNRGLTDVWEEYQYDINRPIIATTENILTNEYLLTTLTAQLVDLSTTNNQSFDISSGSTLSWTQNATNPSPPGQLRIATTDAGTAGLTLRALDTGENGMRIQLDGELNDESTNW